MIQNLLTKSLLLFIFLSGFLTQAQIYNPIDWSTDVESVENSDNEYYLIFSAQIEEGWHLYAQEVPEGGPIPTTFSLETNDAYKLIGETQEEEGITLNDPVFEMRIKYFEEQAVFRQKIKLLNNNAVINASVEFMVCDDERCLPPTVEEFKISVPKQSGGITATILILMLPDRRLSKNQKIRIQK